MDKILRAAGIALVLIAFPLLAVLSSKLGLDKYKDMRSELAALPDSVQIDSFQFVLTDSTLLKKEDVLGRGIVAMGVYQANDKADLDKSLANLKDIAEFYQSKDGEITFLIYDLCKDSLGHILMGNLIADYDLDPKIWKIIPPTNTQQQQHFKKSYPNAQQDAGVSKAVLINLRGWVCNYYDIREKDVAATMKEHMTIVIPAKARPDVEYIK